VAEIDASHQSTTKACRITRHGKLMAKKRSYSFPKNSWTFKNKVSDNVNIPPIDSTTWQMHLPAHNMHIDNPDSLLEEQVHIFREPIVTKQRKLNIAQPHSHFIIYKQKWQRRPI
jgi:hypothetical protein